MPYKSFELILKITKELEKIDLYDFNTTEKLQKIYRILKEEE